MDQRGYRGLVVWQKAMELVDAVYAATPRFPASDQFGLRSQMERSALSIPSNIAEGYARQSPKEYAKHLRYAR